MKKLDIIENDHTQVADFTKLMDLAQKKKANIHRFLKNEATHLINIDLKPPYPIVLLDNVVVLTGAYPSLNQIEDWLGISLEEKPSPCCGGCGG